MLWPLSADDAFGSYDRLDGGVGTMSSSSRHCRRSRFNAAGFGRTGFLADLGAAFLGVAFRAEAFCALGRDDRAPLRPLAERAGLAGFPEVRRAGFLLVLRAAFRVRVFGLRFAITGVLSVPPPTSVRPGASLTVYP
jgi:hypothetical protein